MRRVAVVMYRWLMYALPAWLRESAGDDLVRTFNAGQDDVRSHGLARTLGYYGREFGGLLRTAVRARRPDTWTRRTSAGRPVARTPASISRATMDHLSNDLRFAVRTFRRRPGVTALCVLTLALGIGASTAMFSVVRSVLLKPLPYPELDRLVSVYPTWPQLVGHPTLGDLAERGTWSWPEYFGLAAEQDVFESMGAYEGRDVTVTGEGPAQRVSGVRVTWELMPLLGLSPQVGRLFTADDDSSSGVVLLTDGEWRDRFGADPDVVGRVMMLDDRAFQIIGVLPPGVRLWGYSSARLWFPHTGRFGLDGLGNHGGVRAVARLKEGVAPEQAREAVTRTLSALLPVDHGVHGSSVFPRQQDETHADRPVLLVMLAASLLLLAVACGNAATLLLGMGIDREQEFGLRGALGADRGRLSAQILTESTLLSVAAVVGGVLAAHGLLRLLLVLAPAGIPGLDRAAVDGGVLLFAAAVAVLFGVGFGLIPALSLSEGSLASSVGTGRGARRSRTRLQSMLVVGELALAATLFVGGILLVRTVVALDRVEPGFDIDRLATVAVAPPYARFRTDEGSIDNGAVEGYLGALRAELESVPGVTGLATTSVPPLSGWRNNNDVTPEGWDPATPAPMAERRFVSPGFFRTMGMEIVDGRGFTPGEALDREPYVVVISEGLADLGWPGRSPVGRPLRYWGREATVVGVARNVRDEALEEATELAFYAPGSSVPMLVRTAGDPVDLLPVLRDRVRAFDQDAPILLASTLGGLVSDEISEERYRARLMAIFAGMAGALAFLGVYGVTSRAVSRRAKEIGIRMALGAQAREVWGMVSVQAGLLGLMGAILGLIGAIVASRFLETFLYDVSPLDPVALVAMMILLPLLGMAAAAPPALRAMRVDPLQSLRED